jgi:lauroyl/myristoyl acyltransferase
MGGFWTHGETELRARIVRPWLDRLERQFVAEIIYLPRDDSLAFTRRLVQVLQADQALCVSGEGQIGQKRVVLSFLGRERAFATGMVSLAKLTGAPILPLFCWRDETGETRVVVEPPLDLNTGIKAYAALLEAYVTRYPEQYRGWNV